MELLEITFIQSTLQCDLSFTHILMEEAAMQLITRSQGLSVLLKNTSTGSMGEPGIELATLRLLVAINN